MRTRQHNARGALKFRDLPSLVRDARFLRVAGQVLAVLLVHCGAGQHLTSDSAGANLHNDSRLDRRDCPSL